jgi:hypothetical protein
MIVYIFGYLFGAFFWDVSVESVMSMKRDNDIIHSYYRYQVPGQVVPGTCSL